MNALGYRNKGNVEIESSLSIEKGQLELFALKKKKSAIGFCLLH